MKIIELDKIDSTNEFCKRNNVGSYIVIAKTQTVGRGTKGRSFSSEEGGLYLSVLRKPHKLESVNAFSIMTNAVSGFGGCIWGGFPGGAVSGWPILQALLCNLSL